MNNQPKPLTDRRYIVGYDATTTTATHERVTVFVVDKWAHRIVYKSVVKEKDRLKTYPSIQRMYDKNDCIPPKPIRIALFE